MLHRRGMVSGSPGAGRRGARAVVWLLMALLTGGCWDRIEVEDRAYVITLGLDQGPGERIRVSAAVAEVGQISARTPGQSPLQTQELATRLFTAEADTINQALHILNGSMTRQVSLRHLRAILVGESLSRRGLEAVTMELIRSPLVRGSVALVQARGPAMAILHFDDPPIESNPARREEGYMLQEKRFHLAPPMRLQHFIIRMAATGEDPFLPVAAVNPSAVNGGGGPAAPSGPSAHPGELPRVGGNPVEQVGTAVFRGDRLQGYLSVDETQMLLALRGEMGKAYLSFPDPSAPEQAVTLRFHQENKPAYQTSFRNGRPQVRVRLLFEGELLAVPSGIDYTRPQARARLEQAAARHARRILQGLLAKLQAWGTDPVGFGNLFRGYFRTWSAWEAYNWPRHVQDLGVQVEVQMRLRRYGLTTGGDRIQPWGPEPGNEP